MLDFNKRRILDICKECVSDLEIDDNLNPKKSDKNIEMFLIGADMSSNQFNEIDLERYERYL